eukprot:s4514_g2.t1
MEIYADPLKSFLYQRRIIAPPTLAAAELPSSPRASASRAAGSSPPLERREPLPERRPAERPVEPGVPGVSRLAKRRRGEDEESLGSSGDGGEEPNTWERCGKNWANAGSAIE